MTITSSDDHGLLIKVLNESGYKQVGKYDIHKILIKYLRKWHSRWELRQLKHHNSLATIIETMSIYNDLLRQNFQHRKVAINISR